MVVSYNPRWSETLGKIRRSLIPKIFQPVVKTSQSIVGEESLNEIENGSVRVAETKKS
jgi:hypothetical protein